jgi:hypothetical protein
VRIRNGQRKLSPLGQDREDRDDSEDRLESGNTIENKSRVGPAPSMRAASKSSRGRLSKNRFIKTTLKAVAPAGSQIAQ